jgi:hypothetical protein
MAEAVTNPLTPRAGFISEVDLLIRIMTDPPTLRLKHREVFKSFNSETMENCFPASFWKTFVQGREDVLFIAIAKAAENKN